MFGGQTVGFVTVTTTGDRDQLGMKQEQRSTVDVAGCRHRPLSATEAARLETNVAGQIWKTTAPPEAAAIAAKSTGELVVDGVTYQIIGGAMPFTNQGGTPHKVTILSQIKVG